MNNNENGHNATPTSSSRWPKSEVHALIRLRTNLECEYQENGPKAPLWEEISAGMQRLGYNRNAKRCKEKWRGSRGKRRNKSKQELFSQLKDLEAELAPLRVAKVIGGAPNELSKIKAMRLSIAKILTVISQKQKAALREAYKKKKYLPFDLWSKKAAPLHETKWRF